jgi:orotate phosphoribosyltransferase
MPMERELIDLLAPRHGHFRFESGHHGELWLHVESLLQRPARLRGIVDQLAQRVSRHNPQVLCGPLAGGALVAQMMAEQLDLEFCYSERVAEPVPGTLYSARYRIPGALRGMIDGKRVALVDDVINAGSAIRATFTDVGECGGKPVAIAALLVLGAQASGFASEKHLPLESIAHLPNRLWEASECPLCKAGTPLVTFAPNSPEFARFIVDDTAKWARVIAASGIKPE